MSAPDLLLVTRERGVDRRYGLGRCLAPVAANFSQRGWRVRYLCQDDLPELALAQRERWLARLRQWPGLRGAPGRQLLLSALGERLQMGWFAATVAREQGFTTVHLHDPWLAEGFRLGAARLGLRGVRWGVTEHGFGSYSRATHDDGLLQGPRAQRLLRRLEARLLARAHWVSAPTRLALEQLARDLALPAVPSNWTVIPHATPALAPLERATARRQLGWPQERLVVLGIGRLVPLKRFDLLVRACARLAASLPQLHLQLLGAGDEQPLRALADQLGLAGRLHIDFVDDVQPYLRAADVYVSTSSTESFGLANLEALAAGLPSICTAVGGVPEVVGAGGLLVPVDEDAVAHALAELLQDPEARQRMAARARARARAVPDLDQVTDLYAALYRP